MKNKLITSIMMLLLAGTASADDMTMSDGYHTVGDYTSTADLSSLSEGNVVLLKNYNGRYLVDYGNGTLLTLATVESDAFVWIVEENEYGYGHMFKNKHTGNYLNMGYAGPVEGTGSESSFILDAGTSTNDRNYSYRQTFAKLEFHVYSRCLYADRDSQLEVSYDSCDLPGSTWRFEKLADEIDPCADNYSIVDCLHGESVSLKGAHGKYAVAEGSGEMNANRDSVGSLETFTWLKNGDGTFSLRSHDGRYVTATADGQLNVNTYSFTDGARLTPIVNDNGTLTFMTVYSLYLVAERSGAMNANRTAAYSWERFEVTALP